MPSVPGFAVVGHPNEGKSSVVATLVENDRIRISPRPGETTTAKEYPIYIDGQAVIVFTDTPGFQNPVYLLGWLRQYEGDEAEALEHFIGEHRHDPGLAHECELLGPVARGAGIIYVLDASRPLRRVDVAEMEILRRTGRPRMAILNCKTGEEGFLEDWKNELRKYFHMVRVFHAVRATFAERLRLLESLRVLDQDWEQPLDRVIDAFVRNWKQRNTECAALLCGFLNRVLAMSASRNVKEAERDAEVEARLTRQLEDQIRDEETRLHGQVCDLFRHDRRSFVLPEHSVLREDVFSDTTWTVFGLSKTKLATAAAAAGAAAGAAVDAAALGHGLGIFTVLGGAVAGFGAFFRGETLLRTRVLGMEMGSRRIQVGPISSAQWLFIILDRFFLQYWHVVHWSHAMRDHDAVPGTGLESRAKQGISDTWSRAERGMCMEFFKARTKNAEQSNAAESGAFAEQRFQHFMEEELQRIASSSEL
ncbi:MAG: GTPase/DUF3482 domain-containing protein [Desulfovibrionales bacterium]|nr:GTPase/DUF3482 domain-containing protein [Desulfovibrionales bacterium]